MLNNSCRGTVHLNLDDFGFFLEVDNDGALVFNIWREKISLAAIMAKGVSSSRDLAIPMAMAVLLPDHAV